MAAYATRRLVGRCWVLVLALTVCALTLFAFVSPTARADVWAIPGTTHPGQYLKFSVVDTGGHQASPSIFYVTSTYRELPTENSLWQVDSSTLKSTLVASNLDVRKPPVVLPNGNIIFVNGRMESLDQYSLTTHSVTTLINTKTLFETTADPDRTRSGLLVTSVSVDPAGQIFILFSFGGRDSFVGQLVGPLTTTPLKIKIIAGAEYRPLPNPQAHLPAGKVLLADGDQLLVHNGDSFFVQSETTISKPRTGFDYYYRRPDGDGITKFTSVDHTLVAQALKLVLATQGFTYQSTFNIDSAGDLFFANVLKNAFPVSGPQLSVIRGVIRVGRITGTGENAKYETLFDVGGERPRFTISIGELPLKSTLVKLPAIEQAEIDPLPAHDFLIAATPTDGSESVPLLFRGGGPIEAHLLDMLNRAKAAAENGDYETVRAIHTELVFTSTTGFIPTPVLLNTLLKQHHFPGQPRTFKLNDELVGELIAYLKSTDRRELLVQLRSKLALKAMEEEIPELHHFL